MEQPTREFLQAEYDAAWAHIRCIDDRRLKFVEFHISLNAALATVITAVVTHDKSSSFTFGNFILVFVGAVVSTGASVTILGMLRSERSANIRFRRRVNYIRGMFLESSPDIKIQEYLNGHAELNTPTDKTENIHARGSTLKWVNRLIFGGFVVWGMATLVMLVLAFVSP